MSSGTSLTEQSARRLLGEVCAGVDLDPTDAKLVRLGSNAVFRLTEPVVVRIAGDGTTLDDVHRQILVARWLADVGYPATRALDVDQPVEVDGYVATLLVSVSDRDEYAPIRDVADLIRRLHELDPPRGFTLPPFRPFDGLDDRLVGMTEADKAFVTNRLRQLRERYDNLTFALPPGVIHGDANVGNVLVSRDGKPVLIDLDSFAVGPREWDLVQTALFYERFGWHTAEEYRTFVEVYGFDILEWPGYPVLADYREISMTLWLAGKAENDEKSAAEVRKRVEAIRTDGSRRDWAPF
ncbi:aminoglycoside phosphotransferase [Actinophytocola xinjiangensis]|uniref:Aminoglycoside phosphotransferase n=1 Tax=Actinophytocola xinjiangensis TaxID=485602 RepID=A0A7Z0WHY0_9PSEU|nr:aminoglycoside phosphotransferase [Actinophytocola xinjiangensis]